MPVTASGKSLDQQMGDYAGLVNPDAVVMVGKCDDETGKFLDADQLRYSRAVTQAGPDIVINYLKKAGIRVAERDPRNLSLIGQEWKMSYNWMKDAKGAPINNGLVQYNRPGTRDPKNPDALIGLVGARYLISCSISMYDSSVRTGGGGAAVDGLGVSSQNSTAIVGVTLRLTDVNTGLVISSLSLTSKVTGESFDFHITRLIGDVVNTAATVVGGTATSTVLAPSSNAHVISGELGGAMQAPNDEAVYDALGTGVARILEANQKLFYFGAVRYNYMNAPVD
jgi:curli biogenesis system outer membrane secretion channel CsgG